jgi:hypothetical protein
MQVAAFDSPIAPEEVVLPPERGWLGMCCLAPLWPTRAAAFEAPFPAVRTVGLAVDPPTMMKQGAFAATSASQLWPGSTILPFPVAADDHRDFIRLLPVQAREHQLASHHAPPLPDAPLQGAELPVREPKHVEEIVEWQPDHLVQLRMKEFSPPLSRLATDFEEMWEFERVGNETKVTRSFQLHAKSVLARPFLWVISILLKKAIARHLQEMRTKP